MDQFLPRNRLTRGFVRPEGPMAKVMEQIRIWSKSICNNLLDQIVSSQMLKNEMDELPSGVSRLPLKIRLVLMG